MDELIIKNILGKKREKKISKCCWQLDILCGQKEKDDLEVCQNLKRVLRSAILGVDTTMIAAPDGILKIG